MDLEKIFKNLIIANAVTIVILIIASLSMPKDLMEIAEYVPAGIYGSESGLVLTLLIVVAYIISLILLTALSLSLITLSLINSIPI